MRTESVCHWGRDVSKRLILIPLILMLLLPLGCSKPQPAGEASETIDTSKNPSQVQYKAQEPIVLPFKDAEFTLTPVAKYKVSAMVVSKQGYRFGWQSRISPLDLALAWGDLAESEYDRYVTYFQNNRWYYFRYKADSPVDKQYIIAHSSNHHIIPATENINQALKGIRKKDKVKLEGYLVNVTGQYKGRDVWWNTSLSRSDTGNGSCELFYVTKAQIGSQVFE